MDERKRALLVWHRRAGKDKIFFNKLICKAAEKPANYAYYFPTATLGRKALWKNVDVKNGMRVIDHMPRALLAKPPNETNMMLDLVNGSTIQILGSDNLDVVGGNFFGVAFSEFQNQNPMAWELTRPILAENGGFAWFNGTPRGENHLFDMLTKNRDNPSWFTQVLSCDDTHAIGEADIEEERRSGMSEAMIRQEFFCDFSAPNERAIYGSEMSQALATGRIGAFPVDGRFPVHTCWDLGSPRNTVVWYFQRLAFGAFRFVDIDYGLDLTLVQRIAHMRSKGYSFGRHFLPHDARQDSRTGRTFEQDARDAGLGNMTVVPVTPSVWQGIDFVRQLFPSFEFRDVACEVGIKGLKGYEFTPDASSGTVRDVPLHTWCSHVADALRTMAEAEKHGLIPKRAQETHRVEPVKVTSGFRGSSKAQVIIKR